MLTSILGARMRWHLANGWVFDPAIIGPDTADYPLKEGPHAGRHAAASPCAEAATVNIGGNWRCRCARERVLGPNG